MTTAISLIKNHRLNPIFVKANQHLITKNEDMLLSLNHNSLIETVENLWLLEYNAKISKDENNNWDLIIFQTETDFFKFTLRWN